jgi:hypothetical protein
MILISLSTALRIISFSITFLKLSWRILNKKCTIATWKRTLTYSNPNNLAIAFLLFKKAFSNYKLTENLKNNSNLKMVLFALFRFWGVGPFV